MERFRMIKPIKIRDDKPERIVLSVIKEYALNAKKHPQEQIEKIQNSIQKYGFTFPLLLNNRKENLIICGHGRFKAAQRLGMSEVPCTFAEDLTPEEIKAFRVEDNRISESEWDYEFLIEDFGKDYNYESLGFEEGEVEDFNFDNNQEIEEDNFIPDLEKPPKYKIEKGDVYGLGAYIIQNGKEIEVEIIES